MAPMRCYVNRHKSRMGGTKFDFFMSISANKDMYCFTGKRQPVAKGCYYSIALDQDESKRSKTSGESFIGKARAHAPPRAPRDCTEVAHARQEIAQRLHTRAPPRAARRAPRAARRPPQRHALVECGGSVGLAHGYFRQPTRVISPGRAKAHSGPSGCV
eukprot:6126123-Prymnesium_polylepis.1